MACNESLAALQAMQKALDVIKSELIKFDSEDLPGNTLNKIPDGWIEDVKRFSVLNVDSNDTEKQLTEMEGGSYYIIKEIRFYASGTIAIDAHHGLKDTQTKVLFAQGYYAEGSFTMFTGNRNGVVGRPLNVKPTVVLNSGTGMAAQTWYGSVKYYFR